MMKAILISGLTQRFGSLKEEAWLPYDVPMMLYMCASLVVFAFLYGSVVNTAVSVAREWEDGTVKELLLSPYGHWGVVVGKMLVGLAETFLSGTLVWLATWLFRGFVPGGRPRPPGPPVHGHQSPKGVRRPGDGRRSCDP